MPAAVRYGDLQVTFSYMYRDCSPFIDALFESPIAAVSMSIHRLHSTLCGCPRRHREQSGAPAKEDNHLPELPRKVQEWTYVRCDPIPVTFAYWPRFIPRSTAPSLPTSRSQDTLPPSLPRSLAPSLAPSLPRTLAPILPPSLAPILPHSLPPI